MSNHPERSDPSDKDPATKTDSGDSDEENLKVSETHVLAITRRDNGELAEDIVTKRSIEDEGLASDQQGELVASRPDRVVEVSPAPEVTGRSDPGEPVPGTLPARQVRPSRR